MNNSQAIQVNTNRVKSNQGRNGRKVFKTDTNVTDGLRAPKAYYIALNKMILAQVVEHGFLVWGPEQEAEVVLAALVSNGYSTELAHAHLSDWLRDTRKVATALNRRLGALSMRTSRLQRAAGGKGGGCFQSRTFDDTAHVAIAITETGRKVLGLPAAKSGDVIGMVTRQGTGYVSVEDFQTEIAIRKE